MIHRIPRDYIDYLLSKGVFSFTSDEYQKALNLKKSALNTSLFRLRQKSIILSPVHGYHVIIPPEYRASKGVPAEHVVDGLMKYLNEPYYVALLSASETHGSAHQRPQAFQVMISGTRKNISSGNLRIQFVYKRDLQKIPLVEKGTKTGFFKLSSPEITAFDLIGYYDSCGGMNHVATVISELAEYIDNKKLSDVATFFPLAWAQRLGYILYFINKKNTAKKLLLYIKDNVKLYTPLVLYNPVKSKEKDRDWKIIINEQLEPDEI